MPRRPTPKPAFTKHPAANRASAKSATANSSSTKPITAKAAINRIHAAIRAIPKGSVAGYGVIARRAGLPGHARLVARVLSDNDDPTLPWHRVLRSDGYIAFPADSEGFAEQTQRLRAEGVAVAFGRVKGDAARRGFAGCAAVGAAEALKTVPSWDSYREM